MHATVLADLEVGEVKAEGLHLPDEAVQLPVCQPRSAGAHQRLLEAAQVVEQLFRSRVRHGEVPAARRFDSLGHDQEELPVRLPGRPRLDGRAARAPTISRASGSRMRKRSSGRRCRRIRGQPAADASGRGFEAAQDVLRLDEHGLAGDVGGDLRVAVAIPTHPAAESQKRRRLRGSGAALARRRARR